MTMTTTLIGRARSLDGDLGMRTLLTMLLALLAIALPARGQDLLPAAPAQDRPILLHGGTIHPVSRPVIERGAVLIVDGRIANVIDLATAVQTPGPRTLVIDCSGKHVYPGLVGANTIMGLVEIGAVRATRDYSEVGAVTPEVRAAVAVNPDSTLIPVTRANGVLTCGVLPLGGLVPGRASVIRMDGWTWEDLAIEDDAGLLVNWPNVRPITAPWIRTSEEEQLERIDAELRRMDELFDAAAAYADARANDPTIPTDLRYDAMLPVLHGARPLFVRANELEQIQSAVGWASRRDLETVLVGGRDAHLCTDLLRRHDVGVIVTGTHRLPGRRDAAYDEPFTLPQVLEREGVRWCLATTGGSFETPHERNLPYHAATAVAHGLPVDVAIRAITLGAAELLGVGDELGSIEPGKAATLIVTDGNPLEITTTVEMAFIDGREIDLRSKQTELDRKYREKYEQIDGRDAQ